jgi:thioredoxin-dependent peroxiredoxin
MPQMPVAGDPAPTFELPDESGTLHRLANRLGEWTVVYFYPEDGTSGCTTEACEFRDSFASIQAEGAEVWGISPDDAESHARFRAKHELPFTLLSDAGAVVTEAYGAWHERTKEGRTSMRTRRSTFLVGPDGRVAHAWPLVTPEGHAAEVRSVLVAAKARASS